MTDEKMQRICRRLFDCIPDGTSEKEFLVIIGNFICGTLEGLSKDEVNHHKVVLEKLDIFCKILKKSYEEYMVTEVTKG